jgi:hypothetical protein
MKTVQALEAQYQAHLLLRPEMPEPLNFRLKRSNDWYDEYTTWRVEKERLETEVAVARLRDNIDEHVRKSIYKKEQK